MQFVHDIYFFISPEEGKALNGQFKADRINISEETRGGKRFECDGHVQLSKPEIHLYCGTKTREISNYTTVVAK
jgi:hypothetical protein